MSSLSHPYDTQGHSNSHHLLVGGQKGQEHRWGFNLNHPGLNHPFLSMEKQGENTKSYFTFKSSAGAKCHIGI